MSEKQQRRIVFFLGAGASLGAGALTTVQHGGKLAIPTQDTFWETLLRFCRNDDRRKRIESFLFRYFLGYSQAPARANAASRRKLLKGIDVEEVFTFLSERNRAPGTSSQFQLYTKEVWEDLLHELGHLFARFMPNATTRRVYRAFLKQHVRQWDPIVSFNYDVIFEYSLPGNHRWHYSGVVQPGGTKILKPHGSINWEEIDGRIRIHDDPKDFPTMPIVVAPTHLKFIGSGETSIDINSELQPTYGYLNQSEEISKIWKIMENEMRDAKALVFIGYSFPPSDLYFSSVLRSALAVRTRHPFVVIVNPDSMAIRGRIHSRFGLPLERFRTYSDLQTFNQVTREQLRDLF